MISRQIPERINVFRLEDTKGIVAIKYLPRYISSEFSTDLVKLNDFDDIG